MYLNNNIQMLKDKYTRDNDNTKEIKNIQNVTQK